MWFLLKSDVIWAGNPILSWWFSLIYIFFLLFQHRNHSNSWVRMKLSPCYYPPTNNLYWFMPSWFTTQGPPVRFLRLSQHRLNQAPQSAVHQPHRNDGLLHASPFSRDVQVQTVSNTLNIVTLLSLKSAFTYAISALGQVWIKDIKRFLSITTEPLLYCPFLLN